ncbi:MAG: nuclease-related domain-containing protein [Nocardioides sp.]
MTGESPAAIDAVLSQLPTTEWTIFRDVPWPGRPQVTIPHIAVGPAGVYVIQSDTSTGSIALKNGGLRVNHRNRQSSLDTQSAAAVAIGERLVSLDVRHVHGVVCFVRDEELAGRAGQVLVSTTATLEKQLLGQPAYFSPVRAFSIAEDVADALDEAAQPIHEEAFSSRRTGSHRQQPSEQLRERSARRGARAGSAVLATAGLLVGLFALVVLASMWTLFSGMTDTSPASALDTAAECKRVNAHHPHGVGRPHAKDKIVKGERKVKGFTVGKRLYRELRELDTDRDGIVCEQR